MNMNVRDANVVFSRTFFITGWKKGAEKPFFERRC